MSQSVFDLIKRVSGFIAGIGYERNSNCSNNQK